ncbi:S8 family serine peptidase [Frisingicoccus caecimuris]|uniref:Subtilase family protein n=1 Tax=Frisingicoccus caecimuris TaxID=1796636 RepID=A0A4R2LEK7_9FIRM|nr:S8 family peptidase [Frisingicoccus caecimuris]MCR1917639.1 S8 family serine peptidase [Frisingicoccus caecimuris]TCO85909.1 subtilase family protein [Frisingicoccus caecimuris]HAP20782.1 peptidase S8 [Lachnospiraceae bacterium]
MEDQKIENLLNLALSATPKEREKSYILNVGYSEETKAWDLIVKYTGSLQKYASDIVQIVELYNEYAIITVPENLVEAVSDWPEVEYIEKPKRLYFQVAQGKRASCISLVQVPPLSLTGRGVLVAVIDSGIDYKHQEFLNPDGSSRILYLWDQMAVGTPPTGYTMGREFTQEDLNQSLSEDRDAVTADTSGHGTAVAAIAAGNSGVAYESELIVVRLGQPRTESFPRTTELMQAVNYVIEKAVEIGRPVAINLSFGNTYGSHAGNSLVETYLDDMSNFWKSVLVIGTGNEGNAAGHTEVILPMGRDTEVPFLIQSYETSLNIQIWKSYVDNILLELISPEGQRVGYFQPVLGPQRFTLGQTEILIYYGEPSPFSMYQEIFVDFIPKQNYLDSGQWRFRLIPERIADGRVNFWMPTHTILNSGTRFLYPSPEHTLTIPSTALRAISVAAYDSIRNVYADFSGRGNNINGIGKPDLAAPGVGIRTAAPGNQYVTVDGTSFAAPFVTGSSALLMQYGIVDGNDPFLYGEKVKAYLRYGAQPLPGITEYPNPLIGWGALCVSESLPKK